VYFTILERSICVIMHNRRMNEDLHGTYDDVATKVERKIKRTR
jgi:hypothetical protein